MTFIYENNEQVILSRLEKNNLLIFLMNLFKSYKFCNYVTQGARVARRKKTFRWSKMM